MQRVCARAVQRHCDVRRLWREELLAGLGANDRVGSRDGRDAKRNRLLARHCDDHARKRVLLQPTSR
eukprot:3715247-Pleurochrysis_carterae.AAC.1